MFALFLTISVTWTLRAANSLDVTFSGLKWRVKDTGQGKWGPGPNYFSPDTRNVWVDTQGRLHLAITRRDGKWYCGEVISHRSFGFGRYEWRVGEISPPGELDANVVLGLFTWSDRPEYTHREIDVEVARWGQPNLKSNSQYVVQPWQPTGHVQRFTTPTVANVTHSFTWQPDRVDSISTWVNSTTSQQENFTWSFVNGSASTFIVPQPFDENARMNLWLFRPNDGPLSNASVEVVLDSFTFTSLAATSQPLPTTTVSVLTSPQSAQTVTRDITKNVDPTSGTSTMQTLATSISAANRPTLTASSTTVSSPTPMTTPPTTSQHVTSSLTSPTTLLQASSDMITPHLTDAASPKATNKEPSSGNVYRSTSTTSKPSIAETPTRHSTKSTSSGCSSNTIPSVVVLVTFLIVVCSACC